MFGIFDKWKTKLIEQADDSADEESKRAAAVHTTSVSAASQAMQQSIQKAAATFAKPSTYTGNRHLYDSGSAKLKAKQDAFANGQARDPFTNTKLELRKQDAKLKYGDKWAEHVAEADHKMPLEKVYEAAKNNPFIKNEDIREIGNSRDNLQVVSRKYNNAKRSRTDEEFVNNTEYLDKTGTRISEKGKQKAIETSRSAKKNVNKKLAKSTIKNVAETGHSAGMAGAEYSGVNAATTAGILNMVAVIKGEKTAQEALEDTAVTSGKAAAMGYVMSGGGTILSQSLSSSSSKFIEALYNSNVPGKVITAVMLTGDVLKRYGEGEISTQECILELGEKGISYAAVGYTSAVGQTVIPIPIVGAAVGALVGEVLISKYYNALVDALRTKELEHQERQRIIRECRIAAQQAREFQKELESYLAAYFKEYQDCFNEALYEIHNAYQMGDADGIIAGANQITRKLGGEVYYENVAGFKRFLVDKAVDIL